MTDDDYVAELRSYGMLSTNQAADRIEALGDEIDALTAERDRLREALERISRFTHISPWGHETQSYEANIARAALKGETA